MSSKGIIASMNKGMLPFIIEVKTDNAGASTSSQFTIPTTGSGYSYTIQTSEQTIIGATGSTTLSWASPGTYEVRIFGSFPRILFNNLGDRLKILKIKQWGGIRWSSFDGAFNGCTNLDITATDVPNLSQVTNLQNIFRSCSSLVNTNGSVCNWNTSNIVNMMNMFFNASSFNQNIGSWNVSSVNSMQSMFNGASSFNQNIGSWNVSNVTNTLGMFASASSFNQNISSWDVSKVTTMASMFLSATAFNQNIGSWLLRSDGLVLNGVLASSGMSTTNYTASIVGWANYVFTNGNTPINVSMTTQTGRTFQNSLSGGANFANAGLARTYLTTATPAGAGWTISGDTVIP